MNLCMNCDQSVPLGKMYCAECQTDINNAKLRALQESGENHITNGGSLTLKDSGARREFDTGAVRDISEGKGRCDLLPLHVVADLLHVQALHYIEDFKWTKDPKCLFKAIRVFCEHDNGFDDIWHAILEVSKHYEDGAKKYSENNWMKGIPLHCFIDSGVRHYLKHLRGDTDEPHDRAFVWNMLGAIWTLQNKPELDDVMLDSAQFGHCRTSPN